MTESLEDEVVRLRNLHERDQAWIEHLEQELEKLHGYRTTDFENGFQKGGDDNVGH